MTREKADRSKSCGPKLLDNEEPSQDWSLEKLNNYARLQCREILDGKKLLTPMYWRLGAALSLAKKAFKHGEWCQHLEDQGIDKTQASKARAIHQTFAKVVDVAGLTVEEAYARRKRGHAAKTEGDAEPTQDVRRLRKSVRSISTRAESLIHAATSTVPEEAMILIPAVREAIRKLQELLVHFESQVDAARSSVKAGKSSQKE